jgi:hypothetical protein
LELFSLSLNNSKGFSKKAIIFSGFQAFGISAPGLVDNSFDPDFSKIKLGPGGVSPDRYGGARPDQWQQGFLSAGPGELKTPP